MGDTHKARRRGLVISNRTIIMYELQEEAYEKGL